MTRTLGDLIDDVAAARRGGDLTHGLDAAWEIVARFPEARARGTFWAACLRSRQDEAAEAIATLGAGLESGLWWTPDWLETEPDFARIRDLPAFKDVLEISAERWVAANDGVVPEVVARAPDGAGPFPLLAVLHLGAEPAPQREAAWFPALDHGVAVALIGSPARATSDPGSRTWGEPIRTEADVASALQRTSSLVAYDERVAFAGVSINGRVAAQLALRGTPIAASGFAAIAPAPFDPGAEPLVRAAARGLKAWLVPHADGPGAGSARALARDLERAGVHVRVDEVIGPPIVSQPDLSSLLAEATAFLFET